MDIFILGMGHVGKALAVRLRGAGHRVTGSTTTPGKVPELQQHADQVVVLRVLAHRVEPAMQLLKQVWAAWRGTAWGLDATAPRLWRT